MNKLFVVYGNVGAGKGTFVNRFLQTLPDALYYSSDGIREELSGDVGGKSRGVTRDGKPFDVFATLRERVETGMATGRDVIADSTGMSQAFVQMVNEWRKRYNTTVIRLYCDYETWKKREALRTDRWTLDGNGRRKGFEMPERAYFASLNAKFEQPPNIEINTSNLTPEEVVNQVVFDLF